LISFEAPKLSILMSLDNKDTSSLCKETVFAQVYKQYASVLRNFIYYKFGNLENAEDVTQNAFIKLWENCNKVAIEKAKSFLFTTANNLTLNTIKHDKVVLKFAENFTKSSTNETPEYKMLEKEFLTKLELVIASLSEKQREVFLLNRIEKIKYAEIAVLLGISIKAVEKRMHAALLVMREKIGKI
jgi:RNA polymerase sigma-70 factor (ECF subfamily)